MSRNFIFLLQKASTYFEKRYVDDLSDEENKAWNEYVWLLPKLSLISLYFTPAEKQFPT